MKYFKYVKKDGAIFIDDIDNYPLRLKKDTRNSIVYDLTLDAIKEFYYSNMNLCSLKIFLDNQENGLAMIHKKGNFEIEANPIKQVWNYNGFIKIIYPFLKKIKMILRNFLKK